MTRKKRRAVVPRKLTRKETSRAKREAQVNRWLITGAVAIGVLVITVLAYGYISEVVIAARRPVALVNGVPIRNAQLEARVRYQQLLTGQETTPEYVAFIRRGVLNQMAQEELVRQEAERLGLSVATEDVDRAIEEFLGFDRDADSGETYPVAGPVTQTGETTPAEGAEDDYPARYANLVQQVLNPSGLGVEGFRAIVETSLLAEAVRSEITRDLPDTADQVRIRYLAFPLEAEAEAGRTLERLAEGEDWDAIVEELEAAEDSPVYANELEWRTESYMAEDLGTEIAEALFAAPVGVYPEPLVGLSGRYYLIEVLEREEDRALDEDQLQRERDVAFQQWLTDQMEGVEFLEEAPAETLPVP